MEIIATSLGNYSGLIIAAAFLWFGVRGVWPVNLDQRKREFTAAGLEEYQIEMLFRPANNKLLCLCYWLACFSMTMIALLMIFCKLKPDDFYQEFYAFISVTFYILLLLIGGTLFCFFLNQTSQLSFVRFPPNKKSNTSRAKGFFLFRLFAIAWLLYGLILVYGVCRLVFPQLPSLEFPT